MPALYGSLNPGGIVQAGQYRTSLSYSYSIYPSIAYTGGPTKTHIIGANVSGGITPKLTGQAGLNLAHGSSADALTSSTYDSAGATLGARYLLGPVLVSVTYNWLYYANSTAQAAPGQSDYAFSKNTVLLALSYAFTNQSFFRMGGFGYAEAPSPTGDTSVPSGAGPGPGGVPSESGPGK